MFLLKTKSPVIQYQNPKNWIIC